MFFKSIKNLNKIIKHTKTEMFYDQEYKYHNLQKLTQAIEEYIEYYNNERIKSRLKGLTPKEYRSQASINPIF